MVQAINKNHSKNIVKTYTDDCFYIYNDGLWRKPSTNYYKYFDTDISSLTKNPKGEDFDINDYILSYKSVTNHIKFSETFDRQKYKINGFSAWNNIGLYLINNQGEKYKFPNTGSYATKLQTNQTVYKIVKDEQDPQGKEISETVETPIEHSLSQIFYTKPNELYIASCMVKQVSTSTNNISFQFFNDTYNIGISAKYNLNETTGYDTLGYKEVPYEFINSSFNTISSHPAISKLHNISAGLYKIQDDNGEIYYRLVFKLSCDFSSQMKIKLLLLDYNADYVYTSKEGEEKYIIFANAFQLEKHNDLNVLRPSNYIITGSESSTLKLFDKLFKVIINPQSQVKEIVEIFNKVYYVENIQEHTEIVEGIGVETYLDKCTPIISNPINGDIIIVPSMISFSSLRNIIFTLIANNYGGSDGIVKTYENNRRTPQNGDFVKVKSDETRGGKEIVYQYRNGSWIYIPYDDSVIRFGEVFNIENEDNTINYDLINSQYRIKTDNSYKILTYISEEKNRKSMVKAMTFNQGYFETWCKQDTGDRHVYGYNTGGGFNYHRIKRFYPKY